MKFVEKEHSDQILQLLSKLTPCIRCEVIRFLTAQDMSPIERHLSMKIISKE